MSALLTGPQNMKMSKDKRVQFLFSAAEHTTDPSLGLYKETSIEME